MKNSNITAISMVTAMALIGLAAIVFSLFSVTPVHANPNQLCVGNEIWRDLDCDGIKEWSEPPIVPGVQVRMYFDTNGNGQFDVDDELVAQYTSDSGGYYQLCNYNALPGKYFVVTDESIIRDGITLNLTSNNVPYVIDYPGGQISLYDADFGYGDCVPSGKASLGDRVWVDSNINGIQDEGETGLQDVEVELYDCSDNLVASTTTNLTGNYSFNNLEPGDYYIKVILPTGFEFSPQDQGSDDNLDSDVDPTSGRAVCTTLEPDENDPTWDAGVYPTAATASIGDLIWNDLNSNGIQDSGESGMANITVELLDCTGNMLASTTTDANGIYGFSNLDAGDYNLHFVTPSGYMFTMADQGGDDTVDSDADPVTGETACTTLDAGENDLTWDAGLVLIPPVETASIGDRVWYDLDEDGVQEDGEPGIEGVVVELYDCTGNFMSSITTDVNGMYAFADLDAGDYHLKFIRPAGFEFTAQDQGGDAMDSDANPETGETMCTTLDAGENDDSWDAGLFEPLCSECDGKVTQLTLIYLGETSAQVEVFQKKDDILLFEGNLEPNETFTFVGQDKKGTMSTEIKIYLDGEFHTKIHTSCSQPIGPGLVSGLFEVVEGYSLNGGLLCPVPDQGCSECDGKVTQLTLRYLGADSPVQVTVEQKKDHKVIFEGQLNTDDEFTFNGQDKKGTMGTEIKIYENGDLNTKIHTSCSQPIGPGLVKGDFEVVEGYSRNGGLLCPIVPEGDGGGELCEAGKPQVLTMRYTGEDCAASGHSQDEGKVSCDGDPAGADPVTIIASDKSQPYDYKAKVWFEGAVALNGEFDIDATNAGENRLKAETYVHILGANGTVLQTVKFHTSCSQPLFLGDQFGSLVLVGFTPEGGVNSEPTSGVDDPAMAAKVDGFALCQNHPNPFNPETDIRFELAESRFVELTIYNLLGQKIRTLVDAQYPAGEHMVRWDATDDLGHQVSGGIYLYQIKAGDFVQLRKMSYVR